ncbi:MAG: hypothetical protein P8P44_03750 [Alphaproteobacteria bacterium]|nr:hypothetical protein [Alphaproteobacteria bacterium]
MARDSGLGGLVFSASKSKTHRRQCRFGMGCIALQAIAVIMFDFYVGRIKVVQVVLHCVGEAHLQHQHQQTDG